MNSDGSAQDWRAQVERMWRGNPTVLAPSAATPPAAPAPPALPGPSQDDPKLAELEDFLGAVLPPSATVYFGVTLSRPGAGARSVHHACRSAQELAARLLTLDTGAHEVYFALAAFRQEWVSIAGRRKQRCRENVTALRSAWFDIDTGHDKAAAGKGYATIEEARAALDAFSEQLGIAPTYIVGSGTGLHSYYTFPEAVTPAEWRSAANLLKQACRLSGLRADPVRTADPTSILRPPGCTHRKDPANPRPVAILARGEPVAFERFRDTVARIVGVAEPVAPSSEGSDASGDNLAPRVTAAPVDNSDLGAGLHEAHPYIRGLSHDDALALVASACEAIPDAAWADYDFWALTAIASCVGLHKRGGCDREKLIDLVWEHSRRPSQYASVDREEIREKFDDASLEGCSVGKLFELAEQHGWHAAASVPAPPAQAAESVPVQINNAPTLERYLTDSYVLVRSRGEGEYFQTRRRLCLKPGAVSRAEGHHTQAVGKTADAILKASPLTRRVDFLGFHPGAGEVYTEDAYSYANLHFPVTEEIQPSDMEAALVEHFLRYLFPRAEDQALKLYYQQCLGHLVQRPAVKIATALLFVGGFGVGKNTAAFDIPSLIVGRRNAQVISNKVLSSSFSDQLARAHLVYLDEVHCNGTWQSQEQSNNLKSLVSDRRVVVHPKGHAAYDIPNRIFVTATSNYDDAMFLQTHDRRWAVHELKPTRRFTQDEHQRYFSVLHRFLGGPRAAGVLRWIFGRVSLAGFNAQSPPPMTAAKQRMIEASQSPLNTEILELFHGGESPFNRELVAMEQLRVALVGRVPGLDRVADQRIAEILRSAPINAVRLGQKRVKLRNFDGRWRVWALKNADQWRDASEGAISRHIESGAPALHQVPGDAEVAACQS